MLEDKTSSMIDGVAHVLAKGYGCERVTVPLDFNGRSQASSKQVPAFIINV